MGVWLPGRILVLGGLHCSALRAHVHAGDFRTDVGPNRSPHGSTDCRAYSSTDGSPDSGPYCGTDSRADIGTHCDAVCKAYRRSDGRTYRCTDSQAHACADSPADPGTDASSMR